MGKEKIYKIGEKILLWLDHKHIIGTIERIDNHSAKYKYYVQFELNGVFLNDYFGYNEVSPLTDPNQIVQDII